MNQNKDKQQEQPQVISRREQLMAAYRSAVQAHKSSWDFTAQEWAGFMFDIRLDKHIDLSSQLREVNPRLYQRNLEAAALIQQVRQQERCMKQQEWQQRWKHVVSDPTGKTWGHVMSML